MVFCYKIITDTPRRAGSVSPRKCSPMGRLPDMPSSFSELITSFDYEPFSGRLDWIPEREWRLLGALARKREEDVEREELANQFRRLWLKEKDERNQVIAQTSDQYNRYLVEKREQEHLWYEYKRLQRISEQQARTGRLLDYIRRKDRRSAEMIALANDKKTHEQIDRQLEEDARAFLAADRRTRFGAAEEWRKRVELVDRLRRVEDARTRRDAMLKDTSQRLAINNALSSWETSLLREEVTALDLAKRAQHAAHAALTNARSIRLARARESKQRRARRVAAYTAQLREVVRRKYD